VSTSVHLNQEPLLNLLHFCWSPRETCPSSKWNSPQVQHLVVGSRHGLLIGQCTGGKQNSQFGATSRSIAQLTNALNSDFRIQKMPVVTPRETGCLIRNYEELSWPYCQVLNQISSKSHWCWVYFIQSGLWYTTFQSIDELVFSWCLDSSMITFVIQDSKLQTPDWIFKEKKNPGRWAWELTNLSGQQY
jgi:hypothetical protein